MSVSKDSMSVSDDGSSVESFGKDSVFEDSAINKQEVRKTEWDG